MATERFPRGVPDPRKPPGPFPAVSAAWNAISSSHATVSAAVLLVACVCLSSCASDRPYNPDHLSTMQIAQVGKICETVMGLNPSDGFFDNLWPGIPTRRQ